MTNDSRARYFSNVASDQPSGRRAAVRALQAWQYLIGNASNRQLVRYDQLASVMGYADNRPLTWILGQIMHLCRLWDLPPLTIVVVNRDGTPGPGFTDVPREQFDHSREEVFDEPWFSIVPPSPEEFLQAWRQATGTVPVEEEV